MSLTWNSSKQSSAASAAMLSASGGIGSVPAGLACFQAWTRACMLLHEAVEMDALLACYVGGLEEQIHQHGFAATHVADEVEAGGDVLLGMATSHQSRQQTAAEVGVDRSWIVAAQPIPQILQALYRDRLGGIRRQGAVGNHRAVGRQRTGLLAGRG